MKPINAVQNKVLELFEMSSFNNLDALQVSRWLRYNPEKWLAVIWGRFEYFPLLPLRDLPQDLYNTDTLFLSVPKIHLKEIERKCQDWQVDEFGYYLNGKLKGVTDSNLAGMIDDKKVPRQFSFSLGAPPEKDIAYCRLWWD